MLGTIKKIKTLTSRGGGGTPLGITVEYDMGLGGLGMIRSLGEMLSNEEERESAGGGPTMAMGEDEP